jgi:hypothetical protein
MRVPATLAVLDEADWAKVTNTPIPHADSRSGTLFVPEHLERASTVRPPGLDYALAGEAVLLHEVGHLFFDKLSIQGSGFVNEMVPNLFMAAYIRAARSDLVFMLGGPLASTPEPRYTSGADFIYLREYVGIDNYFWFQMHLQRLADFCLSKGSLSSVLAKIQAEFPGGRSYQLPVDQTVRSLDRLFPGFVEAAGSLAAPSTIRLIQPASCPKVILGGEAPVRQLVIRNYTPDPVLIVKSDGTTTTADPGAWRRLGVTGPARLPDGSCLVPEDEPVLAVLQK